ncbi:cell division FtsZ family protein [bacterium]|nr:cell division FtsZ family protein [bacterium]
MNSGIKISVDCGFTKIYVIGVGGEGGNAINLFKKQHPDQSIKTIAVNTDNQDLEKSLADETLLLGREITNGRGTGANPTVAEDIAEKEIERIEEMVADADMVIICAGLGGGTGSGVSPVIARAAKKRGVLTLSVVTVPFAFEGGMKIKIAKDYLQKLKELSDSVIVIPNWKLIKEKGLGMKKAFEWGNEIFSTSIQVISDIINSAQLMNVDFEDIKTVLKDSKEAYISMAKITKNMESTGRAKGEVLVEELMNFPLIDADTIKNISKAVLFIEMDENEDATIMDEVQASIMQYIKPNSLIIPGMDLKESFNEVRLTLIAGDFEREDSEYYFSGITDVGTTKGNIFQFHNKKVANDTNPSNLFTKDMLPPSMSSDID